VLDAHWNRAGLEGGHGFPILKIKYELLLKDNSAGYSKSYHLFAGWVNVFLDHVALPDSDGVFIRGSWKTALDLPPNMQPFHCFAVYTIDTEVRMSKNTQHVPWILWPFWAIWRLVVGVIAFTGRVVGAILGLVLMIAGAILTITIIGAFVGIPLIIFGFMLLMRSLF
jgi:hypothetical protein